MRYERKYAIKNIDAALVHQVIRLHPGGFRKKHPDRWINNIYFDSPQIDSFYANTAGVSERKKFRLRWYGKNLETLENPIFEIKIKQNQLGKKVRKPWPSMAYTEVTSFKNNFFQDSILGKMMQPALMNSYRRSYYGLISGKFRLTIDCNLSFGPVHPEMPQLLYRNLPLVIIELKYDEASDDEVDAIMQYLPFRQTKSSKYALGISLIK